MEKHETREGKSVGEIIQSDCMKCDRATKHKVLNDWSYITSYEPDQVYIGEDFQIIQCLGCDYFSFRSVYSCSEDFDINDETGEASPSETVQLYPSRAVGQLRIHEDDMIYLPWKVGAAFNETYNAICVGNKILSCAGMRMLLEAICLAQGCEGHFLHEKIDKLVKQGDITKGNSEILLKLRDLGNASLHEIKIHTDDEIDIAFIIIQNLLESVYIIPRKAESIKQVQKKISGN